LFTFLVYVMRLLGMRTSCNLLSCIVHERHSHTSNEVTSCLYSSWVWPSGRHDDSGLNAFSKAFSV